MLQGQVKCSTMGEDSPFGRLREDLPPNPLPATPGVMHAFHNLWGCRLGQNTFNA